MSQPLFHDGDGEVHEGERLRKLMEQVRAADPKAPPVQRMLAALEMLRPHFRETIVQSTLVNRELATSTEGPTVDQLLRVIAREILAITEPEELDFSGVDLEGL